MRFERQARLQHARVRSSDAASRRDVWLSFRLISLYSYLGMTYCVWPIRDLGPLTDIGAGMHCANREFPPLAFLLSLTVLNPFISFSLPAIFSLDSPRRTSSLRWISRFAWSASWRARRSLTTR